MATIHLTLKSRKKAALAAMEKARIDRLVVCSNGLTHIDQSNLVAHMTGFHSIGPSVLLLDASGKTTLLTNPADDAERAAECGVDKSEATDDLAALLGKYLQKKRRKIGHAGLRTMPRRIAQAIASLCEGATAFDDTLFQVTARKTKDEIAAARKGVEIAEQGLVRLVESAIPGRRECDLAVEVNLYMKSLGADDSFLMLNCGPRADAVMPSSERPIEKGDLILCELSPSVRGQFVQICRTISVGKPAPVAQEKYDLLVAAMRKGIRKVKPGKPMGDVCAAIDDHLSKAGYAQFSRPPFIRRRGHGLGGSSYYPGDVSVDNKAILEPGMFFVVHPNQFLPETGYMMCGEPVLVTKTGVEVLSKKHASLLVAGAEARR